MQKYDNDGSSSGSPGKGWSAVRPTGPTPSRTTAPNRLMGYRINPGTSPDGSSSLTGSVPMFVQAFDADVEADEPQGHVSQKEARRAARAEKREKKAAFKREKVALKAEAKAARIAAAAEAAKSRGEVELKKELATALITLSRLRNSLRDQGLACTHLETILAQSKGDKTSAEAVSDGDQRRDLLAGLLANLEEHIREEEAAKQTEEDHRLSISAALKDLTMLQEQLKSEGCYSEKVDDLLISGSKVLETTTTTVEVEQRRSQLSDLSEELLRCIQEERAADAAEKDDLLTIQSALVDLTTIQTRLQKANLTSAKVVGAIRQSQLEFSAALRVNEVEQRRLLLSPLASTLRYGLESHITEEAALIEKKQTFAERKAKAAEVFHLLKTQTLAIGRNDLRAILTNEIPDDAYQDLLSLDTELDGPNLTDRLEKLDAIESTFRSFSSKITSATTLENDSALVDRMLYAKRNQLAEVERPGAQKIAQEQLDRFAAEQEATNAQIPYGQIGARQVKMREILQELEVLQLEIPESTLLRLNKCEKLLVQLHQAAKGATQDITKAVEEIETALNMATLGYAPNRKRMDLKVGNSTIPMQPREMVRGIETGIKFLIGTLETSDEIQRKVLETEGPEKLITNFMNMGIRFTAFGAAPPKLSPVEMYAIRMYTSMLYDDMNAAFRGLNANPRILLFNQIVDEALAKLPDYPPEAWPVFRAERAWDQSVVDVRYKPGNTFVCGQLWSTGARGGVDITGTKGPTFTHVIYGKTGRDIAILSANSGEGAKDDPKFKIRGAKKREARDVACGKGEVLFASTCQFKVVSRKTPSKNPDDYAFVPANYAGLPIRTRLQEVVK